MTWEFKLGRVINANLKQRICFKRIYRHHLYWLLSKQKRILCEMHSMSCLMIGYCCTYSHMSSVSEPFFARKGGRSIKVSDHKRRRRDKKLEKGGAAADGNKKGRGRWLLNVALNQLHWTCSVYKFDYTIFICVSRQIALITRLFSLSLLRIEQRYWPRIHEKLYSYNILLHMC